MDRIFRVCLELTNFTLPLRTGKKIQPATAHGIKVVSIGFFVQEGQPLIWRGPLLHSAIQQFLSDFDWGCLDYLVVDLPPWTGDVQLSLAQSFTYQRSCLGDNSASGCGR